MVKCRFTATYWDYERRAIIDYICDAKEENVLESGFCIFHDENYLQDRKNSKEREQKVNIEFIDMVGESISQKKALVCIGYHLPNIIMRKLDFVKPVYFCNAKFQLIDFSSASFSEVAEADFDSAVFFGEVNFSSTKFSEAHFKSVEFSGEVNFRSVNSLERSTLVQQSSLEEQTFSSCQIF